MMGAGGLAITEEKQPEKPETSSAAVPATSRPKTRNPVNKPDVALEWNNINIKFRIVSQDFHSNDDEYDLYPSMDAQAPSYRSVAMQKRHFMRLVNKDTLSGYIGSSGGDSGGSSERSGDNRSVTSSSANSEHGDSENKPIKAKTKRPIQVDDSTTNGSSANGSAEPKTVQKCPICNKSFTKTSYLKRHIQSHSNVKPFKCEICNWGFYQQCNLKRHMLSHNTQGDGEGFNCVHCQAHFTTKSVLSVHMRDMHGDKSHKKGNGNGHQSLVKTGNKNPVGAVAAPLPTVQNKSPAAAPSQIVQNKSPAVAPSQIVQNKSPATPLPSVQKVIANSPVVKSAASGSPVVKGSPSGIVRSPNSPAGLNKCSICGKQFLTQPNLRAHLLYHRGHKSFKCSVCGSRFAQKNNLRKHMMLSHSGHQCPHCSVMFRSEQDLNQHVTSLHPEFVAASEFGPKPGDEEPMLKLDEDEEDMITAM